jgi:putative ABC transport system permease protein
VLTMRVEFPAEPPQAPITDRTQETQIVRARAHAREQGMFDLLSRVRDLPGVTAAGFTDDMFIAGQGNESIFIPGRLASEIPAGELNGAAVSPGFFEAMRVPLKHGRYPSRDDVADRVRATWGGLVLGVSLAEKERLAVAEPVVVNEEFVRRYFPGENPVGRRFCFDPEGKTYWFTIVGVVGDMQRGGLERKAIPEFFGVYIPSGNGRADLIVRTSGDPLALAPMLRNEVQRAMPSILVVSVATAEAGLDGFSAQRRLQTWLLTLFAALALVLAAVGIFGLAHYAVAERTREIGVRVALGATPGDVLRLMIAQGMRMPVVGIAVGLAASLGLSRILANQLYDVRAPDPATFAAVAGLLALVAASACYLAARRAARADPVRALRQD